uniref:Peptidase C39 family protein n=1 Tax=Candidatus Kentrum sp. FW TaxID=2126338 RepID=A0A450TA77_9GAMM|nr:MAG: Peptidase C39 family protein [Candidatus Kentron sp. FW]
MRDRCIPAEAAFVLIHRLGPIMALFKYPLVRILFIGFFMVSPALAGDVDALFRGVTKQSHDYSCGPAALSTLINGTIPGRRVSELEVLLTRGESENRSDDGFSLLDMRDAAQELGHLAQWKKIKPAFLSLISQPVILLTGLNGPFPHFVVLKGFRNGEAFLADPIRGNIRIPHEDLMEDGLNEKYPAWYVMAIHIPADSQENSFLYLSEADPTKTHFTIAQSEAITLVTIARPSQLFLSYGYTLSRGRDRFRGMLEKSRGEIHTLDVSYGIGDDMEVGAGISRSSTTYAISGFPDIRTSDRGSYVSISRGFSLGSMGEMGMLVGSSLSHRDKHESLDAGVSVSVYGGTGYGQLMTRGSFYKKLKEKAPGDLLPKYGMSWLVGINKPLSDRSLGSLYFTVYRDRFDGDASVEFDHSYSTKASLNWTLNKRIQLRPSLDYSFGPRVAKTFSVGMEVTYVGGW